MGTRKTLQRVRCNFCFWRITSFRREAEVGRYRRIADFLVSLLVGLPVSQPGQTCSLRNCNHRFLAPDILNRCGRAVGTDNIRKFMDQMIKEKLENMVVQDGANWKYRALECRLSALRGILRRRAISIANGVTRKWRGG